MFAYEDKRYKPVPNSANGNCLFEAMSYGLDFSVYPADIRYCVGHFYETFSKDKTYEEGTLQQAIQLSRQFDTEDDDGVSHEIAIKDDTVWANMTDIYICALIYKVNIHLFRKIRIANYTFVYTCEQILCGYSDRPTVSLLYLNGNHFVALELRSKAEYGKDLVDTDQHLTKVRRALRNLN